MDEKIIVLVSDEDDSRHGEISVLDDPHKAERLVETLLEAGFDQNRIRVFNGRLSEFEVSHRPVVALVDEGGAGKPRPAAKAEEPGAKAESHQVKAEGPSVEAKTLAVEAEEPEAKAESRQDKVEEPVAGVAVAQSRAQEQPEDETKEKEQAPATQIAAPVRFSSLFRSA